MLFGILIFVVLFALFGLGLGFASVYFKSEEDPLIGNINRLLPQTQCGQCDYPGCKPYATAIASGERINKCPPGGQATIDALASLLNIDTLALDTEQGEKKPQVAFINEESCIGCTKCIQACPVDAIVGAAKQMHTVIADQCTGCDLCVAPCPVDCIVMVDLTVPHFIKPQIIATDIKPMIV